VKTANELHSFEMVQRAAGRKTETDKEQARGRDNNYYNCF